MTSRRRFLRRSLSTLAPASLLPFSQSLAQKTTPADPALEKVRKDAAAAAEADGPKAGAPYADYSLVPGAPPTPAAGAFTIVLLPDTQHYTDNPKHHEGFLRQTQWIADQQKARSIACVLHLGDITNNNTPDQWNVATKSMKVLDDAGVPYFMAPGNHDYSAKGACRDRTTDFSKFFPPSHFRGRPTFGGFYDREPERVENSFHLFEAAGRKFVVICLEFGPRRDVVRWAGDVAARHAHREAILVTHAFTYFDDSRYDWKKHGEKQRWNPHSYALAKATKDDVTDGEELWQALVSKHGNFVFTANGHVLGDGLGLVRSTTPAGRVIPQMLVNFQMRPRGGDGWLRLLELRPDASMHVCDYSPWRNERNAAPESTFVTNLAKIG